MTPNRETIEFMRMTGIGRVFINSRLHAAEQRRREAPVLRRIGGRVDRGTVLEIGSEEAHQCPEEAGQRDTSPCDHARTQWLSQSSSRRG